MKIKPGMSYLVRKYKESREGYYSGTVFERRKLFYSPAPSEIEEGMNVIHPVYKYLSRRTPFENQNQENFDLSKNG